MNHGIIRRAAECLFENRRVTKVALYNAQGPLDGGYIGAFDCRILEIIEIIKDGH
jgi:hypothetical protein